MSLPALADQTDPRLGDLFADLKNISARGEAAPVERQIWTIWLKAPDEAAGSIMQRGIEAMQSGNFVSAIDNFDRLIENFPNYSEAWNKRATVHYLVGNLDQSLDDITATLDLEPRHFGALAGRGLVYLQLNDLERALVAFEAALDVSPLLVNPRNNVEAIRKLLKEREI